MIGGAEHTIVKMPDNCGRGPYARIASLTPHPNQDILSPYHQSQKPATEQVYSLKFDYSEEALGSSTLFSFLFQISPRSLPQTVPSTCALVCNIYFVSTASECSLDVTDMPDYWDTVVESPPERKRWYVEFCQNKHR
jgi:hypothetical protein